MCGFDVALGVLGDDSSMVHVWVLPFISVALPCHGSGRSPARPPAPLLLGD